MYWLRTDNDPLMQTFNYRDPAFNDILTTITPTAGRRFMNTQNLAKGYDKMTYDILWDSEWRQFEVNWIFFHGMENMGYSKTTISPSSSEGLSLNVTLDNNGSASNADTFTTFTGTPVPPYRFLLLIRELLSNLWTHRSNGWIGGTVQKHPRIHIELHDDEGPQPGPAPRSSTAAVATPSAVSTTNLIPGPNNDDTNLPTPFTPPTTDATSRRSRPRPRHRPQKSKRANKPAWCLDFLHTAVTDAQKHEIHWTHLTDRILRMLQLPAHVNKYETLRSDFYIGRKRIAILSIYRDEEGKNCPSPLLDLDGDGVGDGDGDDEVGMVGGGNLTTTTTTTIVIERPEEGTFAAGEVSDSIAVY